MNVHVEDEKRIEFIVNKKRLLHTLHIIFPRTQALEILQDHAPQLLDIQFSHDLFVTYY